jgi:hypothetical protein
VFLLHLNIQNIDARDFINDTSALKLNADIWYFRDAKDIDTVYLPIVKWLSQFYKWRYVMMAKTLSQL